MSTPETPVAQNKKGKKEKEKKSLLQNILEWVLTILVALAIALPVRAFVFEPVRVDGHSMDDTLADGEIMFVSKLGYTSVWLSMPWQSDEEKQEATRWVVGGDPERFDVVICRYPGRGDTNFVKRVIGLPGDRVRIEDGYLYVNDVKYEEPYINDEYRVRGPSNGYSMQEMTVPEGRFFVMGDHRNNSNDSRALGAIDRSMIIGRVAQIVLPFGQWRSIPKGEVYQQ